MTKVIIMGRCLRYRNQRLCR